MPRDRVPTERQRGLLLVLASGSMLVSGRHGRTIPQLERHGWIAPEKPGDDNGFRITPAGLRALALSVERNGLPELAGRRVERPELPIIVRLRQERDDARSERDIARREASRLSVLINRARRILEEAPDV